MQPSSSPAIAVVGAVVAAAVFGVIAFGRLSQPLLWHDEALTTVFGERVLDYGYPKVHGRDGIHYPMHLELSVGVREELDAYIGSPWAQYYLAALGAAWARGVEDPYAKTWRLRLPFALVGCIGLGALLYAGAGALRGARERWLFAALYLLSLSYSVSLILHLREVRYYALCVLCVCVAVSLTIRHRIHGKLGSTAYTVGLAGIALLLFNSFYLAFAAIAFALGVFSITDALQRSESGRERVTAIVRDLSPLLWAGLVVVPLVAFYDVFAVAGALSERYDDAKNAYGNKLPWLLAGLLRYEFLAPALLLRLCVALAVRGAEVAAVEATRPSRRVCHFLVLVVACSVPIFALAPFYYERYSIALSPLITLAMLLDAFALRRLWAPPPRSRWRTLAVAACSLCLLANLYVRAPEFVGRLREVHTPVRGPLDFVVPYLRERYDDTAALTIATNFEEPSLRYYLGSRVLIGWFNPDPRSDLRYEPDVIIPRPGGLHRNLLLGFARQGKFQPQRFPIRDVPANNVPSLAPWNHARWVHRFETPTSDPDSRGSLLILERVRPADSADPPSTAPGSGEALRPNDPASDPTGPAPR